MYDDQKEIFLNWMTEVEDDNDQKLLKKAFRLDVRKFAFSNRVVNIGIPYRQFVTVCWLLYSEYFLKYLAAELEPETAKLR